MEPIVSTLEGVYISSERASGNTTRIINNAIELLFKGYKINIVDHYDYGNSSQANRMLADRILKRLQSEKLCSQEWIDFNKGKMTMKLK
jgi:hypothetical protein